jgi:hypothetical protein
LARLAESRKTRTSVFSATRPTHWNPTNVLHPQTGEAFTPDGAWEFVGELIVGGVEIETIVLDKPAGRTGYVIKTAGRGDEEIYIKLELGSGKVIGRSFHPSKHK